MEDILLSILKQIVTAILTGAATYYWQQHRESQKKDHALETAVCALLRDRILRIHHDCMIAGYITILALDNVEKLYVQYHELGGNGTITQVMEDLRALPIKN